MKSLNHYHLLILCFFASLANAQQTPLRLATFNPNNGTYRNIGNIANADSLAGMRQKSHASGRSAIAPRQGWYIFIAKSNNNPFQLHTVEIATGSTVYTTPVSFFGFLNSITPTFREFHYSDTLGALIGIDASSFGGKQYLASCNLQTGVVNDIVEIAGINNGEQKTTYSHTKQLYYYKQTTGNGLYIADPISGHIDTVTLQLQDTIPVSFGGFNYTAVYDLQYDDLHGQLYAFVKAQRNGPDAIAVVSINTGNGRLTEVYSLPYDAYNVNNLTDQYYPWALDAANGQYLYPENFGAGMPGIGVAATNNYALDTAYKAKNIFEQRELLTNFQYNYMDSTMYAINAYSDSVRTPPSIPIQTICKVTADSASTHNIIVWEKTNKSATDSFHIYREVATNQYAIIGAIDGDSLSEYHDYGANPNTSSYRYKISVRDTAGFEGNISEYHNSLHVQFTGTGNISWIIYSVGNSSPITTYNVYCDSLANGNWYLLGTVPGTQTAFTDVGYTNHTNALYRVEANFPYSCTAARSASSLISNITSGRISGLFGVEETNSVTLYPNPAGYYVQILLSENLKGGVVSINNIEGQKLTTMPIETNSLKLSIDYPNGIYFVTVTSNGSNYTKKLVINK